MIGRFPKKERAKILRAAKKEQIAKSEKKVAFIKSNSEIQSNPKVRI